MLDIFFLGVSFDHRFIISFGFLYLLSARKTPRCEMVRFLASWTGLLHCTGLKATYQDGSSPYSECPLTSELK